MAITPHLLPGSDLLQTIRAQPLIGAAKGPPPKWPTVNEQLIVVLLSHWSVLHGPLSQVLNCQWVTVLVFLLNHYSFNGPSPKRPAGERLLMVLFSHWSVLQWALLQAAVNEWPLVGHSASGHRVVLSCERKKEADPATRASGLTWPRQGSHASLEGPGNRPGAALLGSRALLKTTHWPGPGLEAVVNLSPSLALWPMQWHCIGRSLWDLALSPPPFGWPPAWRGQLGPGPLPQQWQLDRGLRPDLEGATNWDLPPSVRIQTSEGES